ncbi:hypothetical protein LK08_05425 [Streptomyces sp. MUSC 125]|nr:hypothetical protein LK08_05425 [Streptomyces sp. MUSC 125]
MAVRENNALRHGGPWPSTVGSDLHGRTLGLLGLGKTGSLVARVGLAFGMDVIAWSQNLTEERAAKAPTVRPDDDHVPVALAGVVAGGHESGVDPGGTSVRPPMTITFP